MPTVLNNFAKPANHENQSCSASDNGTNHQIMQYQCGCSPKALFPNRAPKNLVPTLCWEGGGGEHLVLGTLWRDLVPGPCQPPRATMRFLLGIERALCQSCGHYAPAVCWPHPDLVPTLCQAPKIRLSMGVGEQNTSPISQNR